MGGRALWRTLEEFGDERTADRRGAPIEPGRDQSPSAILRAARLVVGDSEALCRVRSISAQGYLAEVSPAPRCGQQVEIEIVDGVRMRGVVESSGSEGIRVKFDTPQDVESVLGGCAGGDHLPARDARIPVDGFATLAIEGRLFSVTVSNISQSGARVTASELPLRPGASASLDLDWFGRLQGSVRWVTPGAAGIAFARPLAFDRLAHWIWATSRAARH
jgi:hypothetical protein